MHVCDGDEGLGKIVPSSEAFEPIGFCWETCSGVEICDCALYAGELVDVFNGLCGRWVGGVVCKRCEMSEHFCGWWDDIGGET